MIGWFTKLRIQAFQLPIVIYRKDNFMYNWGHTSIYWVLSYLFRSLTERAMAMVTRNDPAGPDPPDVQIKSYHDHR